MQQSSVYTVTANLHTKRRVKSYIRVYKDVRQYLVSLIVQYECSAKTTALNACYYSRCYNRPITLCKFVTVQKFSIIFEKCIPAAFTQLRVWYNIQTSTTFAVSCGHIMRATICMQSLPPAVATAYDPSLDPQWLLCTAAMQHSDGTLSEWVCMV